MVAVLLLASLTGLLTIPAASAAEPGDLALLESQHPTPDTWASSWTPIDFEATLENQGLGTSTNRALKWYACEGVMTGPICKSSPDATGSFTGTTIYPGNIVNVTAAVSYTHLTLPTN